MGEQKKRQFISMPRPLDLALANENVDPRVQAALSPRSSISGARGFLGQRNVRAISWDRAGQILCIRPSGELIGTWRSFRDFLEDELARRRVLFGVAEQATRWPAKPQAARQADHAFFDAKSFHETGQATDSLPTGQSRL